VFNQSVMNPPPCRFRRPGLLHVGRNRGDRPRSGLGCLLVALGQTTHPLLNTVQDFRAELNVADTAAGRHMEGMIGIWKYF
jgi:hypothetical protein